MDVKTLRLIGFIALMTLLQVLVFNHIVLFGVGVPLVYVYCLIRQPIGMDRKILMTIGFVMGLIVDIFCDMPGVNALSCVFLVMLRRRIYFAYNLRDDNSDEVVPSIGTLGIVNYLLYMCTCVAVFSLMVFSLEYLSLANIKEIVVRTIVSTLITSLLILAIDSLTSPHRD